VRILGSLLKQAVASALTVRSSHLEERGWRENGTRVIGVRQASGQSRDSGAGSFAERPNVLVVERYHDVESLTRCTLDRVLEHLRQEVLR